MMKQDQIDERNDLGWHALNYRTAAPQHAESMWQELLACVERKVAECAAMAAARERQRLAQPERTRSQKMADAGYVRRPGLQAMEMRSALELIAAPMRPDGTWNRDRAACQQLAAEALGRYEDGA
jgi:hypothetical protein